MSWLPFFMPIKLHTGTIGKFRRATTRDIQWEWVLEYRPDLDADYPWRVIDSNMVLATPKDVTELPTDAHVGDVVKFKWVDKDV